MLPGTASRPTWAEVDLAALVHNYRLLDGLLEPTANRPRLIPVIKADAYGHGALPVARALSGAGATIFAVAIVEEGIELREAGIHQDILVLEGAWPGQEDAVVRYRLIPAVWSVDGIRGLAEAAARATDTSGTVSAAGPPRFPVHLKIDTGMARLGARWDALNPVLEALASATQLTVAGAFTHFASADEVDSSYTADQMSRFDAALAQMKRARIDPAEIHLSNSAGLLYHPETRGWSARPGIALYGYPPDPARCSLPLKPVLTLKSRLGRINRLHRGESIGYNRRFVADRPVRAATVPVGYADGYRRGLTGRARVNLRDRHVPVLGAISMDMIVLDVTEIPEAVEGDEVVLMGPQDFLTAEDWARALGTISYEVLCGISPRVPRVYV